MIAEPVGHREEVGRQLGGERPAGRDREEEGGGEGKGAEGRLEEVDERAVVEQGDGGPQRQAKRADQQQPRDGTAGAEPEPDRRPGEGEAGGDGAPEPGQPQGQVEDSDGEQGALDDMGQRMARHRAQLRHREGSWLHP